MREHHLTVARTARYFTLGDPRGALRQVWFVCHGYRQLAGRFLRLFQPLDDGSRLIVAPEALNRFYIDDEPGPHGPASRVGATWMTREDRLSEIGDYVAYLDALYARVFQDIRREEVEVHVLGFSQGTATASRWVALGGARADHLVLWAGTLPPDLDLAQARERLSRMRVTLVAGAEDELVSEAAVAGEETRLRKHGVAARVVTYRGGHRIEADALRELASAREEGSRQTIAMPRAK